MSRVLIPLVAAVLGATTAFAQARKPIETQDGDVILVSDTARVRIVRRVEGNVRVVYNPAQRWLILLLDQAKRGTPPDGRVDSTYTFTSVNGEWTLGERWEGYATLDDYSLAGEGGYHGLGLTTPAGLVQILGGVPSPVGAGALFRDPAAVTTVSFSGSGRGGGGNLSFDQAEERQIATAERNAAGPSPVNSRTSTALYGVTSGVVTGNAAPAAPVRVGGNITSPRKTQDARPVMPETARQANVQGVVIIELTVGPDGSVSDARILRSIPLLDQAALDAVRQWRYTPTLLNGVPVPVIMTVTVNFP